MTGLLPDDPPPLPAWAPVGLDGLAADLRELEDRLLTDLGGPGWRVSGGEEAPC